MKLVRAGKWLLLLLALVWAWYAMLFFLFMADAFPVTQPKENDLSGLLASAQAYLLVFGPAVIAGLFLKMKWPERKRDASASDAP
jgi:hypothetical protein